MTLEATQLSTRIIKTTKKLHKLLAWRKQLSSHALVTHDKENLVLGNKQWLPWALTQGQGWSESWALLLNYVL